MRVFACVSLSVCADHSDGKPNICQSAISQTAVGPTWRFSFASKELVVHDFRSKDSRQAVCVALCDVANILVDRILAATSCPSKFQRRRDTVVRAIVRRTDVREHVNELGLFRFRRGLG